MLDLSLQGILSRFVLLIFLISCFYFPHLFSYCKAFSSDSYTVLLMLKYMYLSY